MSYDLIELCLRGEWDAVKQHLANPQIEAKREYATSPFALAWNAGRDDVIELLIQRDFHKESKMYALHFAVIREDLQSVEKLVKSNASLWEKNDSGQTALDLACAKNEIEIVRFFLRYALDRKELGLEYWVNCGLETACSLGMMDVIREFHAFGVDLLASIHYSSDWNFIGVAAINKQRDVVSYLLEKGGVIDERTLICIVCHLTRGPKPFDLDFFRFLLDRVSSCSYNKPLTAAVKRSCIEGAKELLDRGANPNYRDDSVCSSLLCIALEIASDAMVFLLIEKGASIDSKSMSLACKRPDKTILWEMLRNRGKWMVE